MRSLHSVGKALRAQRCSPRLELGARSKFLSIKRLAKEVASHFFIQLLLSQPLHYPNEAVTVCGERPIQLMTMRRNFRKITDSLHSLILRAGLFCRSLHSLASLPGIASLGSRKDSQKSSEMTSRYVPRTRAWLTSRAVLGARKDNANRDVIKV